MNFIRVLHFKCITIWEFYFTWLHFDQIQVQYTATIWHDVCWWYCINHGVSKYSICHAWHIHTIDVSPEMFFLTHIFWIFNSSYIHLCSIWKHLTSFFIQKLIPCPQDTIKHTFIKQKVTHPLRDNNINFTFLKWQVHFFYFTFNHRNFIFKAIVLNNLSSEQSYFGIVNCIYMFGSCPGGKDR